jgi:hypothetical protein
MQDCNLKYKWGMRSLDVVLRSELERYVIFPCFQLLIKLANGVEKLAIRLLGCLYRVKTLVNFALDHGESTHEAEQVHGAFSISEGDVTNVVRRSLARELNIHVIIILDRGSART